MCSTQQSVQADRATRGMNWQFESNQSVARRLNRNVGLVVLIFKIGFLV